MNKTIKQLIRTPQLIPPMAMAIITGKPRSRQRVEYLSEHWVQNVFRFYEAIFWRECHENGQAVIRPHMAVSAEMIDGVQYVSYRFFTVEARLAHYEGRVRAYFKRPSRVRVRLGVQRLALANGFTIPMPYLFAVAFDATAQHWQVGTQTTNTVSMVVAATNPTIVCYVTSNGGSQVSCTFNAVSMNKQTDAVTFGAEKMYSYSLAGNSGTHNLVFTNSGNIDSRITAMSYTGAQQSPIYSGGGQTDAFNSKTNGVTSISNSLTTITDNSWVTTACYDDTNTVNTNNGTNITFRTRSSTPAGSNLQSCGDSNGVVHPAGALSQTWTQTTSDSLSMMQMSVSPAGAATDTISVTDSSAVSETLSMEEINFINPTSLSIRIVGP